MRVTTAGAVRVPGDAPGGADPEDDRHRPEQEDDLHGPGPGASSYGPNPGTSSHAPDRDLLLEELGRHHARDYARLRRQAASIIGSPGAAEDIVQQVFAETATTIKRGHTIRDLNAWLWTAVRNRSCRSLRDGMTTLPLDEELTRAGHGNPEKIVQLKESCQKVYRAIDGLTPSQRTVFLLADLRGLKHREIAAALDRNQPAVRQLLTRARHRIRDAVGPEVAASVAPIMKIHAARMPALAPGTGSVAETVAARITSLHDSFGVLLQRFSDAVANPATALATGAVIIAGLSLPATPGGAGPQTPGELRQQPAPMTSETSDAAADRPARQGRESADPQNGARSGDPGTTGADNPFEIQAPAGSQGDTAAQSGSGAEQGRSPSGKAEEKPDDSSKPGNTTDPGAGGNTSSPEGDNTGNTGNEDSNGGNTSPPPDSQSGDQPCTGDGCGSNPGDSNPSGGNPGGSDPGSDPGGGNGGNGDPLQGNGNPPGGSN